jgi:hypothetical protein
LAFDLIDDGRIYSSLLYFFGSMLMTIDNRLPVDGVEVRRLGDEKSGQNNILSV